MSTDPDELRARVAAVLAGVPDPAVDPSALESVDRGQPGGPQATGR